MKISKLDKKQALDVLKAALYVGVSAVLDFLVSNSTGTQFGVLTPVINVVLVLVKKAFTSPREIQ